jgi:hypothetical protein
MLRNTLARSRALLREEGLLSLLRHAVAFAGELSKRLYRRREVFLYHHHLIERDGSAFRPRLDEFELHIVESDVKANELAAAGYEDFRQLFLLSGRNLSRGAVAFCVYVGQRLAHIGWVSMSDTSKQCVDPYPFHVAFDRGEACTGGTYTVPEYRGKGLMAYGYYERFEYLRKLGYTSSRNSVERGNVSSQRAHAKFSPEIVGTACFRRFLFRTRWTECPFPDGPRIGMPPSPQY